MKFTGLKFILEFGSFIQVIIPEDEAKQIILAWKAGKLEPVIGSHNQQGPGGFSGGWAVRVDTIRAIHTFDPYQQQSQPQGQAPSYWGKGSGLN